MQSVASLTYGAFLVGEEDAAVAAVGVGHADVVPVCPVEFPAGMEAEYIIRKNTRRTFDLLQHIISVNEANNLITQCLAKL